MVKFATVGCLAIAIVCAADIKIVSAASGAKDSDQIASRRIDFFVLPTSHIVPMLPLAKELAMRGHMVSFLCTNKTWQQISGKLQPAGVKWVPMPNNLTEPPDFISTIPYIVLPFQAPIFLLSLIQSWTISSYDVALNHYNARPSEIPDLFVLDIFSGFVFDLPIVLNVPYVVVSPNINAHPMLQPNVVPSSALMGGLMLPPNLTPLSLQSLLAYAVRHVSNTATIAVNAATWIPRLRSGLPCNVWPFSPIWRAQHVILGSIASTHDTVLYPSNTIFAGGLAVDDGPGPVAVSDEACSATLAWLDARHAEGRAVVYVSMGTVVTLGPAQMEALADGLFSAPWAVLWSLRDPAPPARVAAAAAADASGIRIERFVAQRRVLAHAAVRGFVSHGGMNSINEAMAQGVPMVIIPFFGDQPDNGLLLAARGAAVLLPKTALDAAAVRDAAARAVGGDPSLAAAAGRMRAEFADAPGARYVAGVLERAAAAGWRPAPAWVDGIAAGGLDLLLINLAVCAAAVAVVRRLCCGGGGGGRKVARGGSVDGKAKPE